MPTLTAEPFLFHKGWSWSQGKKVPKVLKSSNLLISTKLFKPCRLNAMFIMLTQDVQCMETLLLVNTLEVGFDFIHQESGDFSVGNLPTVKHIWWIEFRHIWWTWWKRLMSCFEFCRSNPIQKTCLIVKRTNEGYGKLLYQWCFIFWRGGDGTDEHDEYRSPMHSVYV